MTKTQKLTTSWRLAVTLLVTPCLSLATSQSQDNPFNLTLSELLNVNVSVASRSSLTLSEAPASVSVYNQLELKNMGITHLDELLNFIPGYMSAREDQLRLNTTVIRGRRINNWGLDLLILLDGIRLNDPVSGSGTANISQFSLANIRQVEIIRGPGSALYGSNAFSGVVNLISDNNSNRFSAHIGSNQSRDANVQFHQWLGLVKLTGFIRDQQDQGQNYPPFVEYLDLYPARKDPQNAEDLQLKLQYQQLTISLGWTERVYYDFVQGGIPSDHNQFDRSNRYLQLKYQHQFTNDLDIDLFIEDTRATQDELILIFPAEVAANSPPLGWTNGAFADMIGGNRREAADQRFGFDARWVLNQKHQLQFGMIRQNESTGLNKFQGNWDAAHMEQTQGQQIIPSTTGIQSGYWLTDGTRLDLLVPYERQIYGGYFQSRWQIRPDLNFTGGFRYDDYQDIGHNLSLRGGLVYNLNNHQNLKLLYGEAFRAPTILDTQATFSSAIVGNPDLKPELVKNIDIIWQARWDRMLITANLFFSTINNEMVIEIRQPAPDFFALQLVNKNRQSLSGIELEWQAQLNDNLYLKAGASHFNHQQTAGTARALAFMSLNFNWQQWQWNINGYYHSKVLSRTADKPQTTHNLYLDSFIKINSKLRYRLNNEIDISLSAKNLFNRDYNTYSTAHNLPHGLPERGRQWSLGFDWYF